MATGNIVSIVVSMRVTQEVEGKEGLAVAIRDDSDKRLVQTSARYKREDMSLDDLHSLERMLVEKAFSEWQKTRSPGLYPEPKEEGQEELSQPET